MTLRLKKGSEARVQGDAAHDAAVSGYPVLIGAEADETSPDSVDEGDVGRLRITTARLLKTESLPGAPTVLTVDTTNDNADKTFTPTAGQSWLISFIRVRLNCSTSAGNRRVQIVVRRASDSQSLGLFEAEVTQSASQDRSHMFISGLGSREGSFGTNSGLVYEPLPTPFWLTDTMDLRIFDPATVATTTDDMHVFIVGNAYVE